MADEIKQYVIPKGGFTMDELASQSIEAGLSVPELKLPRPDSVKANLALAERLVANPIPDEMKVEASRHANFKMKRYTVFAIPTLMVYLQGPIRGLPPKDAWRDWFCTPGILKVKKQPLPKGLQLTTTAIQLIDLLNDPDAVARLYNDKDWHQKYIEALLSEGLPLTTALVGSATTVQATIEEYLEAFNYWLATQGFTSIGHWERQSTKLSDLGVLTLEKAREASLDL